jgi:Mrp family chromosome partitioning ATPase
MSRGTLQSTLDQRAGALIGRERERAALLELVERDMPLVAVVHGIAGVGKSTLLQAAAVDARARGTLVVALDGRAFEPTERGFLTSLGSALGTPLATVADVTGALAGDARVLLTIDTYEQLPASRRVAAPVIRAGAAPERASAAGRARYSVGPATGPRRSAAHDPARELE